MTPLYNSNRVDSSRKVIDLSGDGAQNIGESTSAARYSTVGVDFTINGLPVLGEYNLENRYQANVVGGTDSILTAANSFADFQATVADNLYRQISGEVPELCSLGRLSCGMAALVGLAALRKRITGAEPPASLTK